MADESDPEGNPPAKTFGDSWYSLALMVGFIVLGRIYLLEPFKIPSGSMEPTLIGHEAFGDRILTNKLAYVSGLQALLAAGAFFILILQGLSWSLDYARFGRIRDVRPFYLTLFLMIPVVIKSFRFDFYAAWFDYVALGLFGVLVLQTIVWYAQNFRDLKANRGAFRWAAGLSVLILGGMSYAWSQKAIAAEPRRFDVPVFEYSTKWGDHADKVQDINYIKRLTGLPGERIMISGGDLFLYDRQAKKFNIIRKWQERGEDVQNALWFPVSKAFEPRFSDPELTDPVEEAIVKQQLKDLHFPWTGLDKGATLGAKSLKLDGSAPVDLSYSFPVSNIYLKQGRWPFTHVKCPASHLPSYHSPDGVAWRNPNTLPEDVEAVVSNTWEGVQCPNCKHVYFPVTRNGVYSDGTKLIGKGSGEGLTNFFYGGHFPVGDLKVELRINVETAGSVHLEAGNSLRRAVWNIPGGGEADTDDGVGRGKKGKQHFVQKKTAALTPGIHTLSLAYVDGTVVALVDGNEVERRLIDVVPLSADLNNEAETIVRVGFSGTKGEVTALNVSRDLFHTTVLQNPWGGIDTDSRNSRSRENAKYDDGNLVINVQDGEYLMMGDNSPSSSDGRVWGFVPRDRIMGRAWIVGWPLSRCKMIK